MDQVTESHLNRNHHVGEAQASQAVCRAFGPDGHCQGRKNRAFRSTPNKSAAVALLLWRVLAQGSTTWEPRRGPTWAGHRPEGSVGGGLLATHGWRVFGIFRGSHPGSPLNGGGSGRLRRLCSPARAGGLTSLGGANRCRGSASQAGQALPHGPLIRGLGGPWPPRLFLLEMMRGSLVQGTNGSMFYCHKVAS